MAPQRTLNIETEDAALTGCKMNLGGMPAQANRLQQEHKANVNVIAECKVCLAGKRAVQLAGTIMLPVHWATVAIGALGRDWPLGGNLIQLLFIDWQYCLGDRTKLEPAKKTVLR